MCPEPLEGAPWTGFALGGLLGCRALSSLSDAWAFSGLRAPLAVAHFLDSPMLASLSTASRAFLTVTELAVSGAFYGQPAPSATASTAFRAYSASWARAEHGLPLVTYNTHIYNTMHLFPTQ
jgi:hypothetical protein